MTSDDDSNDLDKNDDGHGPRTSWVRTTSTCRSSRSSWGRSLTTPPASAASEPLLSIMAAGVYKVEETSLLTSKLFQGRGVQWVWILGQLSQWGNYGPSKYFWFVTLPNTNPTQSTARLDGPPWQPWDEHGWDGHGWHPASTPYTLLQVMLSET